LDGIAADLFDRGQRRVRHHAPDTLAAHRLAGIHLAGDDHLAVLCLPQPEVGLAGCGIPVLETFVSISALILPAAISLVAYWRKPVDQFCEHYHGETNHPGSENRIIVPDFGSGDGGEVQCRKRLGGLLR